VSVYHIVVSYHQIALVTLAHRLGCAAEVELKRSGISTHYTYAVGEGDIFTFYAWGED
jgi:hypothetical protein